MSKTHTAKSLIVRTAPSLALIKYWGKDDSAYNLPATSSLAVSLKAVCVETQVDLSDDCDRVSVNGRNMPEGRYRDFFDHLRKCFSTGASFHVKSRSNFPVAAGLASSSAGFAAMAYAAAYLVDENPELETISGCARLGSASAARAVYGGFTVLEKGADAARQIFPSDYWPELRVIIAIVKPEAKKISSRDAMEQARKTSPYYNSWIENSVVTYPLALEACRRKDIDALGELMRQSYLGMFATMFTSSPPVFYWERKSIDLIKKCEALRRDGIAAWETMDAGPQVKILCSAGQMEEIVAILRDEFKNVDFITSALGQGPEIVKDFSLGG